MTPSLRQNVLIAATILNNPREFVNSSIGHRVVSPPFLRTRMAPECLENYKTAKGNFHLGLSGLGWEDRSAEHEGSAR